jgi:cytochrome P450
LPPSCPQYVASELNHDIQDGQVAHQIYQIWVARRWNDGNYVFAIKRLHDKYGPVVRIAPNELSFCSATSWRDIYGRVPGKKTFLKTKFLYEPMPGEVESVLSVSNPDVHSHMRRNLSHAFSASALRSQEALIQGFIDKFIGKIGENSSEPREMVTWLNMLTFDIIGELAFGEAFGNLDQGEELSPNYARVS